MNVRDLPDSELRKSEENVESVERKLHDDKCSWVYMLIFRVVWMLTRSLQQTLRCLSVIARHLNQRSSNPLRESFPISIILE